MAQKPARNWAHPRAVLRGEIPAGTAQRVLKNGDIEVLILDGAEYDVLGGEHAAVDRHYGSVAVYHKSPVADDVFTLFATESASLTVIVGEGETLKTELEKWQLGK